MSLKDLLAELYAMLDSHKVSKACDLNVSSREFEDYRMRRMCSVRCSIEEGGHNEEGKQLN